jgi:hypothetical protein
MEAMIRISNGAASGPSSATVDRGLGLIKLQFPSPTFLELGARSGSSFSLLLILSLRFPDLSPSVMHIGLDDDCATPHANKFYHSRHTEGLEIIASGNVIDARRYLCRGCPPSLRAVIWSLLPSHV